MEDNTDLPSLPDLLDELDADVDINSLEQLTQSLLQDIARDLEAAAQRTDCEEPVSYKQSSSRKVVGPTSEKLESSGCTVLSSDQKSLENDISEYLLLHHNYAAKPPSDCTKKSKTLGTKNKFKRIRPKVNSTILDTNKLAVDVKTPMIIAENSNLINQEIVYGTFNEDTNCVMIFVDDNGVPISEAVTEIVTGESNESMALDENDITVDNTMLTIPTQVLGNVSPRSSSGSDYGYESLDSPNSLPEMDIWDQSVSELFPSLI